MDAVQERNSAADRSPVLLPEQQVVLVYPPAPNTLSKSARSVRRARAEDALSNMAGKGYIITEHLDEGVRVLSPWMGYRLRRMTTFAVNPLASDQREASFPLYLPTSLSKTIRSAVPPYYP